MQGSHSCKESLQFAAPADEKNKQHATILATVKHTDIRTLATVAAGIRADDFREEHIQVDGFREQWAGSGKVRLTAVKDILQHRINGHLAEAARPAGPSALEWVTLQDLAMGAIRRMLRARLDDQELADHAVALSRVSSGLSPAEKKQYVELRSKGGFGEPGVQEQLRELEQQVKELRQDKRLRAWDGASARKSRRRSRHATGRAFRCS